ncbi:hypothetical protein ABZ642_24280 [Streptomyces sp. NPDC007157]|uniref:hypothetical protein n=1 Tax=Streptomyces sp. NPDC007157 TaxID=3154681 RepID=UPI0033C9EE3C
MRRGFSRDTGHSDRRELSGAGGWSDCLGLSAVGGWSDCLGLSAVGGRSDCRGLSAVGGQSDCRGLSGGSGRSCRHGLSGTPVCCGDTVGHLCVLGSSSESSGSVCRRPSGGSLAVLSSDQPLLSLIANPPIHSTACLFRR